MSNGIDRREFLRQSALYGGALWAAATVPRPRAVAAAIASPTPAALSPAQWKTVEAIAGRIIPADHEPGAIEAGVVNFIDKALAHEDAALKPLYVRGLAALAVLTSKRSGKPFTALAPAEQDDVLAALEAGTPEGWPPGAPQAADFFTALRTHTVFGFLADPRYGGNRDYVGWKVVGYPGPQHHHGGYTAEQMAGRQEIVPVWTRPAGAA